MNTDRRYLIRRNGKVSFGYYDEAVGCFYMQVDIIGLESDAPVMIADQAGLKLLVTNPDLCCELPLCCWCVEDITGLLEEHDFTSL
jgi:hypothetical protein